MSVIRCVTQLLWSLIILSQKVCPKKCIAGILYRALLYVNSLLGIDFLLKNKMAITVVIKKAGDIGIQLHSCCIYFIVQTLFTTRPTEKTSLPTLSQVVSSTGPLVGHFPPPVL